MTLHLAPCDHEAAKYAVEQWHYSERMPSGKLVTIGVWEGGEFIGVVIFGRGANNRMAGSYGLLTTEAVELVRIALRQHQAPVTRIVRIALKLLRETNPGLRLILSYADPGEGHHGGIYQGGNWLYLGKSHAQRELLVDGKFMHKRSASAMYGTARPEVLSELTGKVVVYGPKEDKHTYVLPLDDEVRARVASAVQPFPKRDGDPGDRATPAAGPG